MSYDHKKNAHDAKRPLPAQQGTESSLDKRLQILGELLPGTSETWLTVQSSKQILLQAAGSWSLPIE